MKILKFLLGWASLLALVGGASVAFAALGGDSVVTFVAASITAILGAIGLIVAVK